MSEEVPEQDTNVFPLEGGKNDSEQDISCLTSFDGISPFLLELRKRSLKLLPISERSILYWVQLFRFVGLLDQWIDPCEENFAAAVGLMMS